MKPSDYQNPEPQWPPGQYLLAQNMDTGEYVRFYPAQIDLPAGFRLALLDLPLWYRSCPRLADQLIMKRKGEL